MLAFSGAAAGRSTGCMNSATPALKNGQMLTLKPMSSLKGYASADVKPVPSVTRELAISAASNTFPALVKQSDIHPEKVVSITPLCRGNTSAHLHL